MKIWIGSLKSVFHLNSRSDTSSNESVLFFEMSVISANDKNGCKCNFKWKIENHMYLLHKRDEYLDSPKFSGLGSRADWYLRLYPKGVDGDDAFRCYLYGEPQDVQLKFRAEIVFEISFHTSDGNVIPAREIGKRSFRSTDKNNYADLKKKDLNFRPHSKYLPRSTLIVNCHMWMPSNTDAYTKYSYATTRIDVERRFFDWPINNFRSLLSDMGNVDSHFKHYPFFEEFRIRMNLYSGGSTNVRRIGIDVHDERENKSSPVFVICKISVLCTDLKLRMSVLEEHIFDTEENEEWSLESSIPVNVLTEKADQYLPNDCLTLHCEFSYSNGNHASYHEEKHIYSSVQSNDCFQDIDEMHLMKPESGSLNSDFMYFFSNSENMEFGDVTLQSADKTFTAHKAILCARSEYFRAVFNNAMKERETNVVNVNEGDTDTVKRMLLFIYSDTLKDLQWESAKKLYEAANFYLVPLLKKKCASFLKSSLCVSNVCHALFLADKYNDKDFKESIMVDYIYCNQEEVFGSSEWDIFTREQSALSAEVMLFFLRKNRKSKPCVLEENV